MKKFMLVELLFYPNAVLLPIPLHTIHKQTQGSHISLSENDFTNQQGLLDHEFVLLCTF